CIGGAGGSGGTAGSSGGSAGEGGSAGGAGGSAGVSGTGGAAGFPSCAGDEKPCDGGCVKLNDPAYGCAAQGCGACGDDPGGNGSATCGQDGACSLSCTPTLEACGGNCVDLNGDSKNCGRCGHDCLAGTCSLGECQRFTVGSATNPLGITADDSTVYWVDADAGEIQQAPRGTTGQHSALVSGLNNPFALIALGPDIVFIEKATSGKVRIVSKSGGTPVDFATAQSTPSALAGDALNVYWGLEGSNEISDGTLSRGAANPQGIALDSMFIYFTEFAAGSIRRMPRDLSDSQPPVELIGSQTKPTAIATNATHVFWVNRDSNGGVYGLPKAGGALITLDTTNMPYDVEVDDTHAYWLTRENGGELRRRGLSAGNVEVLAMGLGSVHSLVVTSDALYWTVQHATDAKVQGRAKP
ncbi:MAG: hypothetical protein AB7K71_29400, partial [Polyangiaceae bacterium]